MKRKLFIGSSKEGLSYANQLKDTITNECGDWLECVVWDEGGIFMLNKSTFENLVKASRRFDYGILIATNDDLAEIRKVDYTVPRDNVIFEMGLFLGSLGLTRAFLATQDCKLPSDYNGITTLRLPNDTSIIDTSSLILQLESTKETFSLKTIPSTALAVGYFDNFIKPFCVKQITSDKPKALKDKSLDNFIKLFCKKSTNSGLLHVLIPKQVDDIKSLIDYHENKNPSKNISMFGDNQRPFVKVLRSDASYYWDIPSTLSTLNKMINMVIPDSEIGMSTEKKDWIEYELRNFKGTLEVLIKDNLVCKDKVDIEWYN
jgi:hypothetical protein